jgi:hypothetical protein
MTRIVIWVCDRCGTQVDVPQEVVVADTLGAIRRPPRDDAHGWKHSLDGVDVCPNCITAGEHVDRLLADVEADWIFGPEKGAA